MFFESTEPVVRFQKRLFFKKNKTIVKKNATKTKVFRSFLKAIKKPTCMYLV